MFLSTVAKVKLLQDAQQFLTSTRIKEQLKDKRCKDIHSLTASNTVKDAFELLASKKLLSVPVKCEEEEGWDGFVDVMDLVTFVLKTLTGEQDDEKFQWAAYPTTEAELKEKQHMFDDTKLSSVIDASYVDPFCPISEFGNLMQAVEEVLGKGIHRAPVVDDRGQLVGLLSQSDIVRELNANRLKIGGLLEVSLRALRLGCDGEVITMSHTAKAIHAFFLMQYHKVSAVCVVASNGEIIANVSASDIRGLRQDRLHLLLQPVLVFLLQQTGLIRRPLTCAPDVSLGHVLSTMAREAVHRVWVVDDEETTMMCPKGVVSVGDICCLLATATPTMAGHGYEEEPPVANDLDFLLPPRTSNRKSAPLAFKQCPSKQ